MLKLMYITNKVEIAEIADKYGVDLVWIDLETLGKEERQKGLNTVKSKHTMEDIIEVKKVLKASKLLVRVNPMNENSKEEIDNVIRYGADFIMLPMFKCAQEVKEFFNIVNNRAKTILLLETKEAVDNINDICNCDGIDYIHIGLNDLHLSYKKKFMFELLIDGTVEYISNILKLHNISFGIGGIAKLDEGLLPAKNILIENLRLGSQAVILSRSFCDYEQLTVKQVEKIFSEEIKKLRDFECKFNNISSFSEKEAIFAKNKKSLEETVKIIVCDKYGK